MPTICQAPGFRAYASGAHSTAIIIVMFPIRYFVRHENKDRETEGSDMRSLKARIYSQVISYLSAQYEKVLI